MGSVTRNYIWSRTALLNETPDRRSHLGGKNRSSASGQVATPAPPDDRADALARWRDWCIYDPVGDLERDDREQWHGQGTMFKPPATQSNPQSGGSTMEY